MLLAPVTARSGTYGPMPARWSARLSTPPGWYSQALCIHSREGAWNSIGYVHGVATYGGGMQFMLGTWHGAGGWARSLSDIARASPKEQLYRAYLVWRRDGRSWREWGTAGACGLR
jgi:hypothetical protein